MPVRNEIVSKQQWGAYIEKHPDLAAENEVLKATREHWKIIAEVNKSVNKKRWIPEETDEWGHELPGDCENMALAKRMLLGERGIPLGALRVCVGQIKRRGYAEGHAVLHVCTDKGDFVLDNLTDEILPWKESRVKPLYRTASGNKYQLAMV